MTVRISFSDVLLIPEFKGLKEFDLLPITMDKLVLPYLHILGLNSKDGYQVIADKHRNRQHKIVTGYVYYGNIRQDEEFRNSPFCSMEDRIIMTGNKDISLTRELCKLSGTGSTVFDLEEDKSTGEDDYLYREFLEDDYDESKKCIKELENIINFVRGNPYNDSGSMKTYNEYIAKLNKD